ncbi:MAG: hypothetical protein AAGC74_11410 [Verrucomicrobiota bacterium]
MKLALSLLLGLILGCAATVLLGRHACSEIDNQDIVRWQLAALLKGNLVAKGEEQQVVMMIRNFIESGICKDQSIQSVYETGNNRKLVAKQIEEFYFSLNEQPPKHVQDWLDNKKISYDGVNDSFTDSRLGVSRKGNDDFLTVEAEFRNISDITWKDLNVSAFLRDKERNMLSEELKVLKRTVKPGETVKVSFKLELQSKEWPEEVLSPSVNLYGATKVEG